MFSLTTASDRKFLLTTSIGKRCRVRYPAPLAALWPQPDSFLVFVRGRPPKRPLRREAADLAGDLRRPSADIARRMSCSSVIVSDKVKPKTDTRKAVSKRFGISEHKVRQAAALRKSALAEDQSNRHLVPVARALWCNPQDAISHRSGTPIQPRYRLDHAVDPSR